MILFLLFAGVYWLYSFSLKPKVFLQKIWMGANVILGAAAITAIAFAYDVETLSTWSTMYVPINLWLNALVGGSIMALLTLQLGGAPGLAKSRLAKVLCALSGVAAVLNAITMLLQDASLLSTANAFGTASEQVPFYKFVILLFALLSAAGLLIYATGLFRREPRLPNLRQAGIACVLVLIAIFSTRFTFYMMHMTVGLAI
jgi:anaerobic dimethyl sulfoxide reductase subunit C (anchor subunit)